MPDTRVLIVADNLLARTGLASLLEDAAHLHVIGQTDVETDGMLDIYRPDVIVVDWNNQPAAITTCPVVLLLPDIPSIQDVLPLLDETPAYALLLHNDLAPDKLAAAVLAVAEGLISLSPALMQEVFTAQQQSSPKLIEQLTSREYEVLQCMAQGLSNKSIASTLNISHNTVKFHVNAIFTKLNVQSRTEAVVRATQLGLIVL